MWYFEYCKEEPHVFKNTNGIFLWGTPLNKESSYIHVDRYSKYRDEENPHTTASDISRYGPQEKKGPRGRVPTAQSEYKKN